MHKQQVLLHIFLSFVLVLSFSYAPAAWVDIWDNQMTWLNWTDKILIKLFPRCGCWISDMSQLHNILVL